MFKISTVCTNVLKAHVVKKAVCEAESRVLYVKKGLSPSSDFMCPRKTFFNFKYTGSNHLQVDEEDYTYEGTRAFAVGNVFHEYIQKQFHDAGVLILDEFTMEDKEHHIRARLDCIIEVNNVLYLVELKSAKSYSMKIMRDEQSPDMEHQKQIQLYFHLLDVMRDDPKLVAAIGNRRINKGIILYESKNDHKLLEYRVDRAQPIINELLHYADTVWAKVQSGKEPKQKFEPDSPECLYKCNKSYYQICHGKPNPWKESLKDGQVWGFGNAQTMTKEPTFVKDIK